MPLAVGSLSAARCGSGAAVTSPSHHGPRSRSAHQLHARASGAHQKHGHRASSPPSTRRGPRLRGGARLHDQCEPTGNVSPDIWLGYSIDVNVGANTGTCMRSVIAAWLGIVSLTASSSNASVASVQRVIHSGMVESGVDEVVARTGERPLPLQALPEHTVEEIQQARERGEDLGWGESPMIVRGLAHQWSPIELQRLVRVRSLRDMPVTACSNFSRPQDGMERCTETQPFHQALEALLNLPYGGPPASVAVAAIDFASEHALLHDGAGELGQRTCLRHAAAIQRTTTMPRALDPSWWHTRCFHNRSLARRDFAENTAWFMTMIGTHDAGFPGHVDTLASAAWQVARTGIKEWVLCPPGHSIVRSGVTDPWHLMLNDNHDGDDHHHRLRSLVRRHCAYAALQQGDAVYYPADWWHATRNVVQPPSTSSRDGDSADGSPCVAQSVRSVTPRNAPRMARHFADHCAPVVCGLAGAAQERWGRAIRQRLAVDHQDRPVEPVGEAHWWHTHIQSTLPDHLHRALLLAAAGEGQSPELQVLAQRLQTGLGIDAASCREVASGQAGLGTDGDVMDPDSDTDDDEDDDEDDLVQAEVDEWLDLAVPAADSDVGYSLRLCDALVDCVEEWRREFQHWVRSNSLR